MKSKRIDFKLKLLKNMQPELSLQEKLETLNPTFSTKEMSRHYQLMDSRSLVNELLALTSKGETVFELSQVTTKRNKKGKDSAGRGIHTVKLRTKLPYKIDGDVMYPEVVIMNSYDGSCPLKVYVGVFRIICSNGLVIATKDFGQIKIRHMGTPAEAAFDVAKGFAKNIGTAINMQQKLAETQLDEIQITEFAKQAVKIRWKNISEDADFEEFTKAIRPEDTGNSVWVVYNRIQEKLMQGGKDVKLDGMKRHAKPVTNAWSQIDVNEQLFTLAMSFCTKELAQGVIENQVEETLDAEVLETV